MPSAEELRRLSAITTHQQELLNQIPKAPNPAQALVQGAIGKPPETDNASDVYVEVPMGGACDWLRDTIGMVGKSVKKLKDHSMFRRDPGDGEDFGEMKANIMLAYRHLEDARMRLGKVKQAMEGGVSILDTPPLNR